MLLGAPGHTTRNKKLLEAKGIATTRKRMLLVTKAQLSAAQSQDAQLGPQRSI